MEWMIVLVGALEGAVVGVGAMEGLSVDGLEEEQDSTAQKGPVEVEGVVLYVHPEGENIPLLLG